MTDQLTDVEARVLGVLIEKELSTPEYYPLSLNALTNACNQTSNRDPITHYHETTVIHALESMRVRSLVRAVTQSGARATKYRHLMGETMGLVARQTALLSVMMLRGPQTLAELKTRTARLTTLESLEEVETVLEVMMARQPTPLVTRLPRRPGQKEVRYAHLLSGEVTADMSEPVAAPRAHPDADRVDRPDRVGALEEAVEELKKEVADLRQQLESFRKQFE